jgi:hypothetical protein
MSGCAQRLEKGGRELRELVEEERPAVGEARSMFLEPLQRSRSEGGLLEVQLAEQSLADVLPDLLALAKHLLHAR